MRIPFIMRIPRDKAYRRSLLANAKKYGVSRQAEATAKPAPPIPSSPSFRHSPTFPFSLSANTFSMLTEALRSVSSLRCV